MKYINLIFLLLSCSLWGDEKDWFVPLGLPPKASPRRISGGESFPPLPLPATPLRRSERKRQPSPPELIGKIVWGESATFAYSNGISCKISDWNLCPSDVKSLLNKARKYVKLRYGTKPLPLSSFDANPETVPILFFSGVRRLRLSGNERKILRYYVLRGGMAVFDSIAGSPYFYNSVKQNVKNIFPGSTVRIVPLDHPIFHIAADATRVKYPRNMNSTRPFFEAIYIGCRIGILISKYGMGCGWDNHNVPLLKKAVYYDVASATKLGLNIIAYAVGYADIGKIEASPELFGTRDLRKPTDEFVFSQIVHDGHWNAHPNSAVSLLRMLRKYTAVKVNLKRVPLVPGKDDLSSVSFLYMTGLDDFRFSRSAVAALRSFINSGGVLLINNTLGLSTFDQAVRRELKQIIPNANLQKIPLSNALFSSAFNISSVEYSPAIIKEYHGMNIPYVEGISINGTLSVIYTKWDMAAGWLGCEPPLIKGYAPDSAKKLGINIIIYSLTH